MLSADAFVRTTFDEEAYHGALKIGDTIGALGFGTVVDAGNKAGFKVGTKVNEATERGRPTRVSAR